VSVLFCDGCIAAATGPVSVIGRVINVGPVRPAGLVSGELLHWAIITSTAPAPATAATDEDDVDEDGVLIRGIPAAAAVSIGGLEITDRLIISVNSLSYNITTVY